MVVRVDARLAEAQESAPSPATIDGRAARLGAVNAKVAAPADGAVENSLQTLFEFDPQTGRLHWADAQAAARLQGIDGTPHADRASVSALIVNGPVKNREAAFDGAAHITWDDAHARIIANSVDLV